MPADPNVALEDILELSMRGLSERERAYTHRAVRERLERLHRRHQHLVMVRVGVERVQHEVDSGTPYRVRIRLTSPGNLEIVARTEPGDVDAEVRLDEIIIRTFAAAERGLSNALARRLRSKRRPTAQRHPEQQASHGVVLRTYPSDGYGFLKSEDGREIHFGENALIGVALADLRPGDIVFFEDAFHDEGPSATTVRRVGVPSDGIDDLSLDPLGWERSNVRDRGGEER